MDLLKQTYQAWATYGEFCVVIKELERYSNRQLNEFGLRRTDLSRIAYAEAELRITTPAQSRNVDYGPALAQSSAA